MFPDKISLKLPYTLSRFFSRTNRYDGNGPFIERNRVPVLPVSAPDDYYYTYETENLAAAPYISSV